MRNGRGYFLSWPSIKKQPLKRHAYLQRLYYFVVIYFCGCAIVASASYACCSCLVILPGLPSPICCRSTWIIGIISDVVLDKNNSSAKRISFVVKPSSINKRFRSAANCFTRIRTHPCKILLVAGKVYILLSFTMNTLEELHSVTRSSLCKIAS